MTGKRADGDEPPEVRLSPESSAALRDDIKQAVAEGILEAMTERNARQFFSTGLEVLREEAASHTGRFILDGIGALAKRALWILIFVVAIYSVGGWGFLKTSLAAIFQGRGP